MASTASYLLRSHVIGASLDDLGCRPHNFCLMPLTLRIEQLSVVAGDERSLLYKPCERFLLSSPHAESARAFIDRRNSYSGRGEDFFEPSAKFFYGNSCNFGTESRKMVSKVGN